MKKNIPRRYVPNALGFIKSTCKPLSRMQQGSGSQGELTLITQDFSLVWSDKHFAPESNALKNELK